MLESDQKFKITMKHARFFNTWAREHGIEGLINLQGIESPYSSALAIGKYVSSLLDIR